MDPYNQSAVIPVMERDGKIRVLMVTSAGGKRWVVPKGIIEEGLSPAASAAREALEEAGVRGRVLPELLGEYAYRKWGGTCRVKVFLMAVREILESWPEQGLRRREWLAPAEAAARAREPELSAMIADVERTARRLGAL